MFVWSRAASASLSSESIAVPEGEQREAAPQKLNWLLSDSIGREYEAQSETRRNVYRSTVQYQYQQPQRSALHYFGHNAPGAPAAGRQVSYIEARSSIREVQFERDRTPAQSDAENRDFASCAERLESYRRSELYRVPQAEALALSVLGFFYLHDRSHPNRVKCNFCRRTFERGYGSAADLRVTYEPEKDLSERLVRLVIRHSLASPYCPFVLGVTADNVPLPENQFRLELETLGSPNPQLCKIPHTEFMHPLSVQRAEHLPDLDDAEFYSNCGQFECEPLVGEFAPSEEEWCLQGQTPNVDTDDRFQTRTIVEMYCTTQMNNWSQSNEVCRLDSFATPQWSQSQPAFSSLAGPNAGSLAKAGFYYTGRGDNVKCWWCGLELDSWQTTDDPQVEHARFSPRCAFLLRITGGRTFARSVVGELEFERGAYRSAHVVQEQRTALREFRDSIDVHSRIVLRHVDPMELSARCDTEVFRTIHEIFQVPVAIVSLAIECQLILFSEDFSSAAVSLEPVWQHMAQYERSRLQQAADYCAEWKRSKPQDPSSPSLSGSILPASTATPSRPTPASLFLPMETPRAPLYSGTSLPEQQSASIHQQPEPSRSLPAPASSEPAVRPLQRQPLTRGAAEMPEASAEVSPTRPLCVVCGVNEREVVFVPCGHILTCLNCGQRAVLCQQCMSPIRNVLRLYYS